jgi:YVTN family beta-propeller protein
MRRAFAGLFVSILLLAQSYRPPAGTRPANAKGPDYLLPGGRLLTPLGALRPTGPGPFGLAVSADGETLASADGGPQRFSLTILPRAGEPRRLRAPKKGEQEAEEDDWRSVFMGLAFDGDHLLYAAEGNSGRVRLMDTRTGKKLDTFDLNRDGFRDSFSGDLALDRERRLLFVADQANFRVVALDLARRRMASSVRVGRLPFALALDGQRLWVTHVGMFEYQAIPGADRERARETGLPFPAFGFPSREAERGAERRTGAGTKVKVPGLGSPHVREANSVAAVDFSDPAKPRVEAYIPTGVPFGPRSLGGSSPSGVALGGGRVFVSNATNDSITVIDPKSLKVEREILLRMPGLAAYRGVLPVGLAYHEGRLYVAEAGINAVGVVDAGSGNVLGHVPSGWFPTRVVIDRGTVYVSCAKGTGTGPNAGLDRSFQGDMRRGAVQSFPIPADPAAHTAKVLANNGFLPGAPDAPVPAGIRNVVIIVKENRTFDEVFGDLAARPDLARFGEKVTPNHHAIARRWAYGDNFYSDSEVSVDGHHWLAGVYPNAWTESTLMAAYAGEKDFRLPTAAPGRLLFAGSASSVHPEEQIEAGSLWHHLERHRISFRNFGEGFELAGIHEGAGLEPTGARLLTNVPMPDPLYRNTSRNYPGYNMNIPDQYRADQLIAELQTLKELPRLIFVHLPNDHIANPRPEDGYPTRAAFVADNDYALGRIVAYLSARPEWEKTVVLVTEDDPQGGVDHVDSHRTVFLMAGAHVRPGCVVKENASFGAMFKLTFRILGIPPLSLFDAAAGDLAGCLTPSPDTRPYQALQPDPAIFDPARVRAARDPKSAPRMDDPREVRRQQRR